MGLIFDINSAGPYESWYYSPRARAMEKLVEESILSLLNPQPGERVLDIGCGVGNHLLFFNKLGLDVNGIDASPYMINRCRERLGNRVSLKTGLAEDLPFDDNEFDIAVLINTLEFLDDPLLAIKEAGRVANRRIFIGVMNSFSWHYLQTRTKGLFRESFFSHINFYNLWELKSFVQKSCGDIPIEWSCSQLWPHFFGQAGRFITDRWSLRHCPIGSFLGLAATIVYKFKTDNLTLKARMKKPGHSVVSGLTMETMNERPQGNCSQSIL